MLATRSLFSVFLLLAHEITRMLTIGNTARDKMMAPRYQEVPSAKIPEAATQDGLATVRVIAGTALRVSAVIDTRTPIIYHHWELAPGARVSQPLPPDHNVGVYVFDPPSGFLGT